MCFPKALVPLVRSTLSVKLLLCIISGNNAQPSGNSTTIIWVAPISNRNETSFLFSLFSQPCARKAKPEGAVGE